MSERRDDTSLFSLICPHCGQTTYVPQIREFAKQQLLYLKCGNCEQGITRDQIAATWRDYKESRDE